MLGGHFDPIEKSLLADTSRLANRTLRIVTIEEAPYVIIRNKNLNRDDVQPGDIEGVNFILSELVNKKI